MTWIQPMHNRGTPAACTSFFIKRDLLRKFLAVSKGLAMSLKKESRECYMVNNHCGHNCTMLLPTLIVTRSTQWLSKSRSHFKAPSHCVCFDRGQLKVLIAQSAVLMFLKKSFKSSAAFETRLPSAVLRACIHAASVTELLLYSFQILLHVAICAPSMVSFGLIWWSSQNLVQPHHPSRPSQNLEASTNPCVELS